jgi:hypothetical protein
MTTTYALLWDLADGMAKQDHTKAVHCWSQIMNSYWSGELPDLFCFMDIDGWRDEPMQLPSRSMAMMYLHGAVVEPQMLRDWRPEDYRPEVSAWVSPHPRFGLAIRRADFKRWRIRCEQDSKQEKEALSLSAAVAARLATMGEPGSEVPWDQFCEGVRDDCKGWTNSKKEKAKRGYGDKTIRREVSKQLEDK